MRAMLVAFAAIVVISVGAGVVLNEVMPRSGMVGENVRLGD